MRLLACLALSTFAAGCGALAGEDSKGGVGVDPPGGPNVSTSPTPSCTRERTAPLVMIEGVASSSATVGPCGDIMFEKTDGSVWLRTASGDGTPVQLAGPAKLNAPGGFDSTGTYVSFAREGAGTVVRKLDSGEETILPESAHFGFDPQTRMPIVYTCTKGVRVLHGGVLGTVIAGTESLGCGPDAPFGKTVLVHSDTWTNAVAVDLVAEKARRLEIDYRGSDSGIGRTHRRDGLVLSRDGNVALYQATTWEPCGDTECPKSDGYDIILTATGKVTQHVGPGYVPLDGAFDFDAARANALVERSGAGSIDTLTGTLIERKDASRIGLQRDGTLILQRSDRSGSRITTARAGETTEKEWLSSSAYDTSVVTWPTGRRAILLERTGVVKTADGQSNWGGSGYGDLIVRDESGAEIARHASFTSAAAVAFPADGAVILVATRFATPPPASAVSTDDLDIVSLLVRVAPDGSLSVVADTSGSLYDMIELDARSIGAFQSQYDASISKRTSSYDIYDLARSRLRNTISGNDLRLVRSTWPESPGVVALEDVSTGDFRAPAKLWHGVADR